MSSVTVADAAAAPSPRWLAVLLVAVAAIETIGAISDLPAVLYQYNHPTALLTVSQALFKAKLVLAAPLAAAALVFAARGRLRLAIGLLAALALTRWLSEVPTSLLIHGSELSNGFGGAVVFAQYFVYPLIGLAALALAWRGRTLGIAAALVALPTLAALAMIAGFAIGVAIYGF